MAPPSQSQPRRPVNGAVATTRPTKSLPVRYGKRGERVQQQHEPDWDLASTEELVRQHKWHEQEIDAAERRMLKTVAKTHAIGEATCEKLHSQGEQLKRLDKDTHHIGENLKTSAKIMRSLESWTGMIGQSIFPSDDRAHHSAAAKRADEPASDPEQDGSPEVTGTSARGGTQKTSSVGARNKSTGGGAQSEPPDNMDQISQMVESLKAQADEMNRELKAQSKQIDSMSYQVEDHTDKMKQTNQRARKLLGRKKADNDDDEPVPSMNPLNNLFRM